MDAETMISVETHPPVQPEATYSLHGLTAQELRWLRDYVPENGKYGSFTAQLRSAILDALDA